MKRLPILVLLIVAGVFLAFRSLGTGENNPPGDYEKVLKNVGAMLMEGHYSPKSIDDEFSKKIFTRYFGELDPARNIFLTSDIESLRKYETRIDDEIKGAPVEFFLATAAVFNKRMEEASLIYKEVLSQPFDFTVDESANLDGEKTGFAKTESDRKEAWRKRLKYLALERYADLLDIREKNKGVEGFVVKTDEELEKEAREKVMKIMDRSFDRYRNKFDNDEKFSYFVNTITKSMDPHTDFFPPVDKRYFDEQMSGRFYGIGASLIYDEGNIKINTLLAGSPAWKSGEVQAGDIILKVAQGKEEPIDLIGYEVEDAVKVIRGKKGTEVNLTLKKQDGTIKLVTLFRDEIVQDETFARSAIVKNSFSKIGYIYLSEFYADFERPNGARCAVDVANEVRKLKAENVDGIILDLRNNGGGSLYDVVQMAGLFIDKGPIVQVKDRDGKPSILEDRDRNILYDGPLAVMVNEFSASASEIFAAAIQDYNRGVVIGSTSTYGKGTVQRNIGLDPSSGFLTANSDIGTIKLTLQKFYRINGGSTQLRGVNSDIVLPDNYEYLKLREKDDPDALPWDEISKATYSPWNPGYDLTNIRQLSKERVENNVAFNMIRENTEWLARQSEKEIPLKLDVYKAQQKKISSTIRQIENLKKLEQSMNVSSLPKDADRFAGDTGKQERFNNWIKNLQKDIYLDQASRIMTDMITQRNLALGKSQGDGKKAF